MPTRENQYLGGVGTIKPFNIKAGKDFQNLVQPSPFMGGKTARVDTLLMREQGLECRGCTKRQDGPGPRWGWRMRQAQLSCKIPCLSAPAAVTAFGELYKTELASGVDLKGPC